MRLAPAGAPGSAPGPWSPLTSPACSRAMLAVSPEVMRATISGVAWGRGNTCLALTTAHSAGGVGWGGATEGGVGAQEGTGCGMGFEGGVAGGHALMSQCWCKSSRGAARGRRQGASVLATGTPCLCLPCSMPGLPEVTAVPPTCKAAVCHCCHGLAHREGHAGGCRRHHAHRLKAGLKRQPLLRSLCAAKVPAEPGTRAWFRLRLCTRAYTHKGESPSWHADHGVRNLP